MLPASQKWVVTINPQPNPRLRLICFPYSGGAAHVFSKWPERLPADVEIIAIQYPGRSSRFSEPLITDMNAMVCGVFQGIQGILDCPIAVFGHSLGAGIAFEVCRKLEAQGTHLQFFFPSGRNAPHIKNDKEEIHQLSEEAFTEKIRNFNGTPTEVLENPELMELMVPILRADFTISETFTFNNEPKLKAPVRAFGADADPHVQSDGVFGWAEYTENDFDAHIFEGHHFFIHGDATEFFKTLAGYLTQPLEEDTETGVI